jgi:monoamine oxidase
MARTKLFTLLRKTFEKARIASALGLTDKVEIDAAYRRHRAEQGRSRRDVLAMFGSAAALGVVTAACGDDGGGTGGGSGGGSSGSTTNGSTGSTGSQSSSSGGQGGQGGEGGGPPAAPEVVAVVGAGIAGLHCAMRLREADVDVTVYDMQNRVGGRMFTGRGLFAEDQICELGGELIDSNHATLFALAEELEIELDDRLVDTEDVALDTYFIDGVVVADEVILQQFQAVADVMADDAIAADEDEEAYAALDEQSLDAYLQEKVPVAEYPELHAILQIAYRGEFGLENDQQSALNMIYLIGSDDSETFRIFGESDERYHAHDGNDVFPTRIAEVIGDDRIRLEHKLTRIADGADGGFELVFETPDGDVTVQATRVVFALPFSVLRDVDTDDLTLSEEKRDIIDNLGYGTNAKIMGGFETRFWLEEYSASGSLYTDGPLQQTWDTSIGQEGVTGILTNFVGGQRGVEAAEGTPETWWGDILSELATVWPGAVGAFNGEAVRMHWPTAEGFKGSYTCYRVGQWAYWSLEGVREGNLHFCGEHTSLDFQGWMEGGAETGALVAGEILGDLEVALSPAHVRSLGIKLHVPQSTYSRSGGMLLPDGRRMNAFQRRRAIGDVVRKAKAALDARVIRDAAE